MKIVTALFLLLVALCPALVEAQQPAVSGRRTMEAVGMIDEESITLDGRLDEAVWLRAVPATNFIQQDPNNGEPATEQTEVRIIYNADKLYIGVTLFDSEPEKLIYYQMGRDGFLPSDDKLQWAIDTFLDGRSAYWWEMNPAGSMADALRGANNANNRQWDGIWDARAHISEIGWTLEIEVPFRTMNFNPASDSWGINFARTIARKNEVSLWSGWARNQGLNRMANAGLLTGIRDVTQGLGLDVKPYAVATAESFPGRTDLKSKTDADAGVDVFYNITPSLRANITVNTDFAQAEVDARQINLTRFSLLFPEKRDFFLDGALFFDFASSSAGGDGTGDDLIPFFSRSIGLDSRGRPQRINFGTKLTGQVGRHDIGFLQVQTGNEDTVPGENFTVMRIKRRLLSQSYIGGMYTVRDVRGGDAEARHTAGIDFRLATSSFLGRQNLNASGYFLRATNHAGSGKNSAYGAELAFPNDPLSAGLEYMEIQDNYDAAIGYTRRKGFRKIQPSFGFAPRPRQHPWIRRFNFAGNLDWRLDPQTNKTLTREFAITAFDLSTHRQDAIQVMVIPTYELLEENFRIAPSVRLPAGSEYSFTRYRIQGSTTSRRPIAVSPQVEWGNFYSGDRLRLAMTLNHRLAPGQMLTLTHEWNRVSLTEGRFFTRLYRGIVETQFNPRVSVVNNIQYDTQSAVLGWQSRFRWIVRPGNDLYFVYIHNWLDDPVRGAFSTLDRRASAKVAYTHRF